LKEKVKRKETCGRRPTSLPPSVVVKMYHVLVTRKHLKNHTRIGMRTYSASSENLKEKGHYAQDYPNMRGGVGRLYNI